jgi:hypothetical protein
MKAFFDTVWNRVVGGYKSTLIGVGLAVLVVVLEAGTEALNGLPQGWAKALAALLAIAGASIKPRATPPVP